MMQEYLLSFDPIEDEKPYVGFYDANPVPIEYLLPDGVYLAGDASGIPLIGSSGIYTPKYIMWDSLRRIYYETNDPLKD